jgi:hypothetical protein
MTAPAEKLDANLSLKGRLIAAAFLGAALTSVSFMLAALLSNSPQFYWQFVNKPNELLLIPCVFGSIAGLCSALLISRR